MQLSLTALRFQLHTSQPLAVPPDKYPNVVRGALGLSLRAMSCPPDCLDPARCPANRGCSYAQLFEAENNQHHSPSGIATAPRPFVLRVQPAPHGLTLGIHLFGPPAELVPVFTEAVLRLATAGLGPSRIPARIAEAASLDHSNSPSPLQLQAGVIPPPVTLPLAPTPAAPARIRVHFLTPTELKHDGILARRPDFPILFNRVRDRVLFLATHYHHAADTDHGPLARALAEQALQIQTLSHQIHTVQSERQSTRTGQRHSLGGFIGHADYAGDFTVLWPWLLAAQWTGVGRQTVWGKGQIRCEAIGAATNAR